MPLLAIIFVVCLNVFWAAGGREHHNEVVVLQGHEANIPCVTMPSLTTYAKLEDEERRKGHDTTLLPQKPKLIWWYKDGVRSSIYSYDGRDPDNERHWSPRRSMGGSLRLTLPASPFSRPQLAFLNIRHVHETDAGLYHCQVDFRLGPGRSTFTKLVVVVPPSAPTIEVWAEGRWLHTTHETSTATVEVGTRLSLRCSTSGGEPTPSISWWRGGQQLLSDSEIEDGGQDGDTIVSSAVNVTVVAEDAHTPIVCQATNTHLMPPLRTPLLLLVLSPPQWIRVVGAEKPMSAGTTYTVECRCVGARPPPVITWTVGGDELTTATSTTDSEGETTSRLRFTPKAAHSGTHITCTAHPPELSYSAISPRAIPTVWFRSDSVPLKIQYRPEVQLEAQLIRKRNRNRGRITTSEDNDGESDITKPPRPFTPSTAIQRNKIFKATRPEAPEGASDEGEGKDNTGDKGIQRESKTGGSKNKKALVDKGVVTVDEFVGIVLQCNIRANPPAYHVSWHNNDVPLTPLTSPGILLGNMSAVFQSLKRTDAGNLTCTAHNKEGSTRSAPILLQINHGPECARDTPKILGVPRHHTLNVTCEVESYPPPDSFSWALRSTRGTLAVPPEMIHSSGTTSWIKYTPRANVDFGELLCWASSPLGRQDDPCIAKLVSAEKPDTPENCKVTKTSQEKVTVACKAAHDGGLPQTFFMKVFHGGQEVTNSTSVNPEITAYDLEPGTRYRLTIWSANTHGTSTGHTTLFTSTLPSNTSSTTSSMNGHSDTNNPRGLLTKFGSSILAVVVVVTVVGVVIGIIVGILVQRVDQRFHNPRRDHEDDDDEEERPPTLINNNQINLAVAGIGRVPKCLEPLGRSTTRYDIMTNAGGKGENHVYDDPITLREECMHEETTPLEDMEVTPEVHYPPFSITTTDYCRQAHNFSWHLPNSRLLRNKFYQRYPVEGGCPRKPVRVETPRLPEFDISTTVTTTTTTRRKFQSPSGMEFRLILVPETSKMLQVALERDTKLASYLRHEPHLSNSHSKFPTITEEEDEMKNIDATDDLSATPYESTPDDFSVENGQNDTSELLPRCCISADVRNETRFENRDINKNRINSGNYSHLREYGAPDNIFEGLEISSENIPSLTIYSNTHQGPPGIEQQQRPTPVRQNKPKAALQNITNARASLPSTSPSRFKRASLPVEMMYTSEDPRGKLALLGSEMPKRATPSIPPGGKIGRHHPYGGLVTPNSARKGGVRSPSQTPSASGRKMGDLVISPTASSATTPNMIPTSPFSLLRKPKIGVTSLLSLVSSSSSTSSAASSSYASRRGRGSRDTTMSPMSEGRRRVASSGGGSYRRPSFRHLRARPKSVHVISGPEHVLHWWGEEEGRGCQVEDDRQSSSTPSSPRSSTSSSCFPYSSMSSSPVSSFYSSENSLSISGPFSHTSSSSSSFCFSSSSPSSSSSSSPFSSFLSPSLTTPSSSSVLSLSSCSPTPDSVFSGHITPT